MAKKQANTEPNSERCDARIQSQLSDQGTSTEATGEVGSAQRPHGKRRREDLFLGDTELFAFDFGGAATATVAPEDEDMAQAEAARQAQSKELEAVTSQLTTSHEAGAHRRVPLTLAQVQQCAAAARHSPLTQLFFFPGPGSAKRTTRVGTSAVEGSLAVGTAPRPMKEEPATLTSAHTYFANGLRKYDEGLWRVWKAKKEEEKSRKKKAKKQGTSAK